MSKNLTIMNKKLETRNRLKGIIKNITIDSIERQSNHLTYQLTQLDRFRNSSRVSVYLSMPTGEIRTNSILKWLFDNGKSCFVPRYDSKKMEMVKINSFDELKQLPLTKWNIPQPPLDQPLEEALETGGLDLMLVPGVAFTKDGKRMGHGKGYYDYYIQNLLQKQSNRPYLIGLALNEQIIDDIPVDDNDARMDLVLFENNQL